MISFGNFCHKNCGVTRPQFEEAAYCCSLFCTDVLLGSSIHSCSKFDGSHHHVANVDGLPSSREGEIQLHQQDSDLPLLNVPLRFEIFANNKSISTAFKGTNCSTRGRTPATGRGAGKVWISMCLGCDVFSEIKVYHQGKHRFNYHFSGWATQLWAGVALD